jgi:hypothetical protein
MGGVVKKVNHFAPEAAPAADETMQGMSEELHGIQRAAAALNRRAIVLPDGTMRIGNFTVTRTGLLIGESATPDEWKGIGLLLLKLEGAIQWLIGDWFVYGEQIWGRTYRETAEALGYSIKSLYTFAYVAENVHFSIRMENLTFGHHALVAKLPPEEQYVCLQYAAENNLSIAAMRTAIKGEGSGAKDVIEQAQRSLSQINARYKQAPIHQRQQIAALYRKYADELERDSP